MLVTNVIYIIIFIVVAIKIRNESNEVGMVQYGTAPFTVGAQPMAYQTQVPTAYVSSVQQQPQSRL
jgi:hypothetical protein